MLYFIVKVHPYVICIIFVPINILTLFIAHTNSSVLVKTKERVQTCDCTINEFVYKCSILVKLCIMLLFNIRSNPAELPLCSVCGAVVKYSFLITTTTAW